MATDSILGQFSRCLAFFVAVLLSAMPLSAEKKTVKDIQYSQSTDEYARSRCKLDICYPTDTCGNKVVVWYHGGGLTSGEKQLPGQLCREKGVVVVGVNYRLLPKVDIDTCLDDCAQALAWVFKHIGEYGGDSSKIVVTGHSAGGYIAAMLGLDKSWLGRHGVDADSLAAVVPFSGQAISHFSYRKMHDIPNLQPTIDKYAPLYHVRPDAPPIILITGDRELELFGRYEENAYLWRMLKLVGHPYVKLYEIGGHNHGGMGEPAHHILLDYLRSWFM